MFAHLKQSYSCMILAVIRYTFSTIVDSFYLANSSILDDVDRIGMRKVTFLGQPIYLWEKSGFIRDPVEYLQRGNYGEERIASTFEQIASMHCKRWDVVNSPIVLDIGANYGIYGIYSAIMGCSAYMFEVQPACQQYMYASAAMNRVSSHAFIIPFMVGDAPSAQVVLDASTHCFGVYRTVRGSQHNAWKRQQRGGVKSIVMTAMTLRIDDMFSRAIEESIMPVVALVKIDTEGFEHKVLTGMRKLLGTGLVREILVELSPMYWPHFKITRAEVSESIVSNLWDQGYRNVVAFATTEVRNDIEFSSREQLYLEISNGITEGHQIFHFRAS